MDPHNQYPQVPRPAPEAAYATPVRESTDATSNAPTVLICSVCQRDNVVDSSGRRRCCTNCGTILLTNVGRFTPPQATLISNAFPTKAGLVHPDAPNLHVMATTVPPPGLGPTEQGFYIQAEEYPELREEEIKEKRKKADDVMALVILALGLLIPYVWLFSICLFANSPSKRAKVAGALCVILFIVDVVISLTYGGDWMSSWLW